MIEIDIYHFYFFITTHPWDVGAKKVAGTQAGKQFYSCVDTERAAQSGNRLVRSDEAIMSPDWISNECIMCVYDAVNRESTWVNRTNEPTRNGPQAKPEEQLAEIIRNRSW